MRRTQDIVAARLRELARRWRVPQPGSGPGLAPRGRVSGEPGGSPQLLEPEPVGGQSGVAAEPPGQALREPPGPGHSPAEAGDPPASWGRLVVALAVVALGVGVLGVLVARPRLLTGGEGPTPQVTAPAAAGVAPTRAGPADAPATALGPGDPFASPAPSATTLVVHVAGDVRSPGVVRLPAGSRVVDAVAAAGGVASGGSLGAVNLARVVADGERIEVGASAPPEGAAGAGPPGSAGAGGPAALVDLNAADAQQLDALPGIGPVTAAKILAWRAQHGRFTVVDELAEVSGIGPRTLEEIRPHVRV